MVIHDQGYLFSFCFHPIALRADSNPRPPYIYLLTRSMLAVCWWFLCWPLWILFLICRRVLFLHWAPTSIFRLISFTLGLGPWAPSEDQRLYSRFWPWASPVGPISVDAWTPFPSGGWFRLSCWRNSFTCFWLGQGGLYFLHEVPFHCFVHQIKMLHASSIHLNQI